MVQLKQYGHKYYLLSDAKFQFHNGTIKTCLVVSSMMIAS